MEWVHTFLTLTINLFFFSLALKLGIRHRLCASCIKRFDASEGVGVVVVAFLLACEDLGRMFDHSFPDCAFFFFSFFF